MLELLIYTISAYALLGLLTATIVVELELVKRNKLAKQQLKGWSLSERE